MVKYLTLCADVIEARSTIAAVLLAALRFDPVRSSTFADADVYLTNARAMMQHDAITPVHLYANALVPLAGNAPGWFPLAPLPLALWLLDPNLFLVKLLQYALVLITFGTFAYIARRLLSSGSGALVAVVVALAAWQFRSPHDPVVGTSFVAPWGAELLLLAIALWCAYCNSGNVATLLGSAALEILACLATPVAWFFGIFVVLRSAFNERRKRAALVFAVATFAPIAVSCFEQPPAMPWTHHGSYPANVVAQAFAALPATFRASGNIPVMNVATLYHATATGWRYVDDRFMGVDAVGAWGWLPILVLSLAAFWAMSRVRASTARRSADAIIVGALLVVAPSLLLGSQTRYQQGLPLGQAFGGIYFEYLGIGLLAACGALALRRTWRARLAPAIVALVVMLLAYGNVRADAYVLDRSQRLWSEIAVLQRAAASGLFDYLPSGAQVSTPATWGNPAARAGSLMDPRYALLHYSGKWQTLVSDRELARGKNVWELGIFLKKGVPVQLAHVAGYVARQPVAVSAIGFAYPEWRRPPVAALSDAIETVHGARNGQIVAVRHFCEPVAIDRVFDPAVPIVTWGPGFDADGPEGYRVSRTPGDPQPWGNGYFPARYPTMLMGKRAQLTVTSTGCDSLVAITATVLGAGTGKMTVTSADGTAEFEVLSQPTSIQFSVASRAGLPSTLVFRADGPRGPIDNPLGFRYQRDVPRDLRVAIRFLDMYEEVRNNRSRGRP